MKGFCFLFLLFFVVGCKEVSNSNLAGNWTAVSMKIDDKKVEVDLSEVALNFDKNGGYNFTSTLNYREAGYYQIAQHFLFTIDTLNENSSEKKVEIIEFSGNEMIIKMREKDEDRSIRFKKN